MSPRVEMTLFWVCVSLASLFFLCLFLYGPVKRFLFSRNATLVHYRTVRRVTLDNDYYLINRWEAGIGSGINEGVHIDHIIFGDKFIYVIKDRYYSGAIKGEMDDKSWVLYQGKGKRIVKNPVALNRIRADRLSMVSGLNRSFFISIVLVNDDCMVIPFAKNGPDDYIISASKLGKFIESQEKREDVPPFSADDLATAVRDLAALNHNVR